MESRGETGMFRAKNRVNVSSWAAWKPKVKSNLILPHLGRKVSPLPLHQTFGPLAFSLYPVIGRRRGKVSFRARRKTLSLSSTYLADLEVAISFSTSREVDIAYRCRVSKKEKEKEKKGLIHFRRAFLPGIKLYSSSDRLSRYQGLVHKRR